MACPYKLNKPLHQEIGEGVYLILQGLKKTQ